MRPLVWFRSDLRTRDNTALHHAAAAAGTGGQGVIGAYVISPGDWRRHDVAACRVELTLRTLADLSAALGRLNISLLILSADRPDAIPDVLLGAARRASCDALYFNREYEVNESRRDAAATALFERAGLRVQAFHDQVVLPPDSVRTGEGRFYTVFTPYKRAWLNRLTERGVPPVLPPPRRQQPTGVVSDPVPVSIAGFESAIDPARWPAGESAALARLRRFTANRLGRYKTDRDIPAIEGTSALSPYLACGAISPRQCLAAAIDANAGRTHAGRVGPDTWISELIWREFFVHILVGFPRVCTNRAFRPAADRIRWREDDAGFAAWCEGRTGFPIVDAAMRQLAATGWMHNRLRMIAAMFLAKDLLIDWRRGERHFMRSLIDGFFASNNGGWQWSAGTGADAAPYFRIFNPAAQSQRFDPRGDFIRRWVPELAALDADEIHDPPSLARGGYPPPIVDHAAARQRALRAFGALKAEKTADDADGRR